MLVGAFGWRVLSAILAASLGGQLARAGRAEKPAFEADQRGQLKPVHLVVVTVELVPFMFRQSGQNSSPNLPAPKQQQQKQQQQEWSGYCMDLLEELVRHLPYNVTYEIYQIAGNNYGVKPNQFVESVPTNNTTPLTTNQRRDTKVWSGIVGELQQGNAHLALAPLSVMAERELVIDFTVPFYDLVGSRILIKRLDGPSDYFKFIEVLDGQVWLSIGLAYLVTSGVIYLFDRLSPSGVSTNTSRARSRRNETTSARKPSLQNYKSMYLQQQQQQGQQGQANKAPFSFQDSLWFCITSLTPQGGHEYPAHLGGRLVGGAWWLFCFIIIASYTANLAAFLTVSRLDVPIESMDDLIKQYRIKYAPYQDTADHAYFERMAYIEGVFYNIWKDMSLNESLSEEERAKFAVWDYPIGNKYTKVWAQIRQARMPKTYAEAMARVRASNKESGFALIADAMSVNYAIMTDCSLKSIGDEFSRKPIAIGVQKHLGRLRHDISNAILEMVNERFMEKLREKWWKNNPNRVVCGKDTQSESVGAKSVCGVFIIILAGVLVSLVAWTIERLAYKTKLRLSQRSLSELSLDD